MSWWKLGSISSSSPTALAREERQRDSRISWNFKVRHSVAEGQKTVLGQATVVDLFRHGFGLTGALGLKQGRDVALFLKLPESSRLRCTPQVRVLWLDGQRCGVHLLRQKIRTMDWTDARLDCH